MILVDTSVLVTYWRSPSKEWQRIFVENEFAICGVTRAELCHGARHEANLTEILAALDGFTLVPVDEALWDELGRLLFTLRASGCVVSFQDAMIAAVALRHDLELWTLDADFKRMSDVIPALRLYVPNVLS